MHFDINIVVLLVLNIGLALAFAYYGNRLLGYQRLVDMTQIRVDSYFSGLEVALKVARPITRFSIPRIRMKTDSSGDEPPHMPF